MTTQDTFVDDAPTGDPTGSDALMPSARSGTGAVPPGAGPRARSIPTQRSP